MTIRRAFFLMMIFLSLAFSAYGEVEWEIVKTLPLSAPPLGMTLSADGKKIFVLLPEGEIQIYSSDGKLEETLKVEGSPDAIDVSTRGDRLFLKDAKGKNIRIVSLAFRYDIDISGSPFRGPVDAPVVVTVFSDFQCPYCSKLAPLLDQVHDLYPDTVKIAFKNFPLRTHKFAREAAVAALAADAQGKFWPFHDLLFKNYSRLNEQTIGEIAVEAGLDLKVFEEARKDRNLLARIDNDVREALRVGLTGTPTVYVNGRLMPNRSLDGFKSAIEAELQKVKTPKR